MAPADPGRTDPSARGVVLEVGRPNGTSLRPQLESAGYVVMSCPGPSDERSCPLLTRRSCPLLPFADGVLFRLALTDPTHREILDAYRRVPHHRLPIQIVPACGVPDGAMWESTFDGFKTATAHTADRRRLTEAQLRRTPEDRD